MDRQRETIERLKKVYRDVDDQDSLDYLDVILKDIEKVGNLKDYAELEITKTVLNALYKRYKVYVYRLIKERNLTDDKRQLIFVAMDWCEYTIGMLGGTTEHLEKDIQKIVEDVAVKAGITK